MLFTKILVEKDIRHHPQVQSILNQFKTLPVSEIDRIQEVFGKVKKPYLQKRKELQLFLGKKRGTLLREAPPAYGGQEGEHYYFIHAYNCIYECEYCYLQGYFNSPDIVLFLNHDEIGESIRDLTAKSKEPVWFHAGEFSDSLALTHLTGELEHYFKLFKQLPTAFLELRTKSGNIKPLLEFEPLANIVTSFSLAPKSMVKKYDHKTPSLAARLKAIGKLIEKGFPVGLHFDPIIFQENTLEEYRDLSEEVALLFQSQPELLRYISVGVVRFTKDVFHQVKSNYPDSSLLGGEFIKSFDGKVRYPRPLRIKLLSELKEIMKKAGIPPQKVYLCME